MNWQQTLEKLVKRPSLHGKFLNTLSLMEYIGARKIVKSQKEEDISSDVLAHMVEEIRHAQIFKKMALKVSDGRLKTYDPQDLLAGAEGRDYLQVVDRGIESLLGHGHVWENYLLSTLIIEERANKVYPVYAELLEPLGFAGYLKTILREEEHHLQEIQEELKKVRGLDETQLSALRQIEEQAFLAIISQVELALQGELHDEDVVFSH